MSEETNVVSTPVNAEGTSAVEGIVSENEIKDAIADKAEAEGSQAGQEESPQKDEFSSKFAALSRKEKELRQRQQEFDAKYSEYEAWKKSQEEAEANKEPELPLEYKLRKDPLGTLQELGIGYDKLTDLALNDGKLPADMQMDLMRRELEDKYSKELESIRTELADRDKRAAEKEYEQTINSFKTELTDFVNEGEKYELIRANDAVDLVFDVIEHNYNTNGTILSHEEAANIVESQLEEELKRILPKAADRFGYRKAEEKPVEKPVAQSPTLSNSQTSHVSTNGSKPLSDEESLAAAAQLIKWDN